MKFLVIILLGIALYGNTSDTYALTENLSTGKVLVDSSVFRYFPLTIGNRWVYYTSRNFAPGPEYNSFLLQSTQLINVHLYYKGRHDSYIIIGGQHNSYDVYYRIDSLTGNLYSYNISQNTECLVDSLNASRNDTAKTGCQPNYTWYKCDTSSYTIFNQNFPAKKFSMTFFEGNGNHKYVKDIGEVYSFGQALMSQTIRTLRGCIINGVLRGDTSILVGINQIGTEIPEKFSLSQNYPNPFNPVTKIKFDISGISLAQTFLYVYDLIGREIAVLVNQHLKPGTYEVDFDGSNLPSGVYYYKLESGGFIETKKMVLIK